MLEDESFLEIELKALYKSIAETINEMIPEPREKFLFYAQVFRDRRRHFFIILKMSLSILSTVLKFRLNLILTKMNSISVRWNYLN